MTPHISIIMPCYNAAAYLPQSVGSVFAQTRGDWELVIVDDGSTDASWQEMQRLAAADPRIRVLRQPNTGAAAARNRALLDAHGAYASFLDADDTWHPEFLEVMEAALVNDPDAGIAYCGWQNIGLGGGNDDPFVPPEYECSSKTESLLEGCRWPIHAALVRTRLIHDCGRFDESLSSCMDFDLWLRLGTIHRLIRVPRVLAYYHHHGGEQITRNRARIALNHWRAQQKYLRANPVVRAKLGNDRVRELTDGALLMRGYASYWDRDLSAARKIFRAVMMRGYGTARDWKYMLSALLPLPLHQALILLTDRGQDEKPLSESDVREERVDGMTPDVSIIMPCHNAEAHLPQSVGSVLAQTFPGWELIAVDDGSSDGTLAWLQAQTDPRLQIHAQANQGVSAARNAGLRLARGKYVAFLDADDTWAPNFMEKLLAALKKRPDAVLAYCGWKNRGLPGLRGEPFIPPDHETAAKRETLFAGCRWPIHAALTKREAIMAAGGFDPSLKNAEDYALWLEVAGTSAIVRVPEVLAHYHFHGGTQASSNRHRAALHLLYAQQAYLDRHPDFAVQLGRVRRRDLLYGNLLKWGYESYWKRDLPTARTIFRRVMRSGYGRARDWLYMLPALLPMPMHKSLLKMLDNSSDKNSRNPENRA